jgi:nucleoside-triphosphatase THEP1
MVRSNGTLILWTGQRHSGKTTMAARLAQIARREGFEVGGLLAPSVYRDGILVGFDCFDLRGGTRTPLLRRGRDTSKPSTFTFVAEGLKLGKLLLACSLQDRQTSLLSMSSDHSS